MSRSNSDRQLGVFEGGSDWSKVSRSDSDRLYCVFEGFSVQHTVSRSDSDRPHSVFEGLSDQSMQKRGRGGQNQYAEKRKQLRSIRSPYENLEEI